MTVRSSFRNFDHCDGGNADSADPTSVGVACCAASEALGNWTASYEVPFVGNVAVDAGTVALVGEVADVSVATVSVDSGTP